VGRKKGPKIVERVDKPGRIRSAWYVLMGRAKTIEQIHGEWAIIQAQAAETFNRFNALAARLVRAERNLAAANVETLKRLEAGEEAEVATKTVSPITDRAAYKAELRHRASARMRQLPGVRNHVHGDQGSEVPG